MRIVVLGAGTVGYSVAAMLCRNGHSVTVVDSNAANIKHVNETLDVRGLSGSASQSSVLFQSGVIGCDLCLAVTGDDEVNLVSASMAKAMGARRTVARVYAPVFRDLSTFDYQRHFRIDRLISLEHLSAMELARGIRHPGSVVVENLARGEIEVHEMLVSRAAKCVGKTIRQLELPGRVRVGSITHEGTSRIASAEDRIEAGDRLTVIGARKEVDGIKSLFCGDSRGKLSVVIAGGGETGYHLARILEAQRFNVTLFESDRERCNFLASQLQSTTVVNTDATRRDSLQEERVGAADVFAACTGDDENNIMAAVEARDIGTKRVMALVSRPDYAHVVGKLGIDITVSPREVVAKQILGYLNSGPLISRTSLGDGGISVLEIEVLEKAVITENVLANLSLPERCLIAAVIRSEFAFVPGGDDRLKPGDTVVVMVDEEHVDATVRMFGDE
ncbi:Trk system potassium transporter TrkA [Aeoliella mucimassa]|uniref:Trk system potassium uptake protein TrkA n=1 Tax=Aeoliella mucimassa TaxID=2527972 RepID=A0A518ARW2_9BACT|nr:Trk system potassium transporter TrkA [Aeoliella mucimassa]QDU57457.1 Trk system potassium uptake protein TrkA [Aeoliella mucimassa]